jgi:hypothetical protein
MFNMEIKFNKEMAKSIGEKSWRLTKKIAIKGTQALVAETTAKALNAAFEGDYDKMKNQLTFDGIVGEKPEKKPRKKLFSKKQEENEDEELIKDISDLTEEAATVEAEVDVKVEKDEDEAKTEVKDKE